MCGLLACSFAWNDKKAGGSGQPLQLLADDLFCGGVDGEGEHLFAHCGGFDAKACAVDGPRSCAEQLRCRLVTGFDQG